SWHLAGGTISGGTITSTGGMALALTNSGGTLAGGIVIAAGVAVDATQQLYGNSATVTGGLTLNGSLDVGSVSGDAYGRLTFQGTQTLGGTGTVALGGSSSNALLAYGNSTAATLT